VNKLLSRKLWVAVVAFFAPIITQYATGAIGWKEALRLSVLAAVGYCVAQGVADADQAAATGNKQAAETIAAARQQLPPVPKPREYL